MSFPYYLEGMHDPCLSNYPLQWNMTHLLTFQYSPSNLKSSLSCSQYCSPQWLSNLENLYHQRSFYFCYSLQSLPFRGQEIPLSSLRILGFLWFIAPPWPPLIFKNCYLTALVVPYCSFAKEDWQNYSNCKPYCCLSKTPIQNSFQKKFSYSVLLPSSNLFWSLKYCYA